VSRTLRLADLLAGLSVACDLGFSLPPEEAMRSCLIATSLGRRMGMDEEEARDTFYTALLIHVGCSAISHETALAFGDDRVLLEAIGRTNVADPEEIARVVIPAVTAGRTPAERAQIEATAAGPAGQEFGRMFDTGTCEVASITARRVGLGPRVARSLKEAVEWWNGEGPPDGLAGEEIASSARVARAAADAARFDQVGGRDAVVEALRARAGVILDPGVVEALLADVDELLTESRAGDPRTRVLEVEPEPWIEIGAADLTEVATAFGDLADLKTPWTHGHSSGVAELANSAAAALSIDARSRGHLEVAGPLHDLGRVAISNAIWEKPGPLSAAEWEQVRMHSYHSERILATSEGLAPMARLAGMHHERLDGSGYFRSCAARELDPAALILAAADAFQAMTQDRPHREARTAEQAADEIKAEIRAGRLERETAIAVLEAAGAVRPRKRENLRPAGLTDREVEVVGLVAAGCSNPEIAEQLVISRRTAEHHVQNIYAKVGVASRAGLALFAHENRLIETLPGT
jgi:HD-GYP domain-containing protein (c-di-GMP phosphodiesterase class II)/DNA-binding CsgD family transcriptional regulator